MKIIFLDFDGVINNFNTMDLLVNPDNVFNLLEIIGKTNAKIVATTPNKYSFQIHNSSYYETNYYRYLLELQKYGIEIYDITPYMNKSRELEIQEYLNKNPNITDFVIIDDDYIMKSLINHQVFIDLY